MIYAPFISIAPKTAVPHYYNFYRLTVTDELKICVCFCTVFHKEFFLVSPLEVFAV
jgi:hypothetical protein